MVQPDLETAARVATAALAAGRSDKDAIAELIATGIRDTDARQVVWSGVPESRTSAPHASME